jgi:GNAT superfamily N-acetyltransferase
MSEPNGPRPEWRPTTAADLQIIQQIGDQVHVDLPERAEVFAEKFTLFPEGCLALVRNDKVVGYGFSHPWILNDIPPLDTFLEKLPEAPQCIFVHDVVVLPEARKFGAADRFIELIANIARRKKIESLALVSVYETHPLWARFGFVATNDPNLQGKLQSYGGTARYMVRHLN